MSDIIVIQPDENNVVVSEVTNSITTASDGPQGPAGPTGATGATGPAGSSGVVAVTAPITNSGTSSSANIGISAGTTSAAGALQLEDSVASTSTTTAATPNSVKTAYNSSLIKGTNTAHISGNYYRMVSSITAATTAFAANITYYTPIFIPTTTTYNQMGIRTATTFSGTGSVRLGIYNDSAGKPGTLLLDAGTFSATSPSTSYAITINQSLNAGFYWFAWNSITAATTNTYQGFSAGSGTTSFANAHGSYNFIASTVAIGFNESINVTSGYSNAGTLGSTTVLPALGIRVA